MLFEMFVFLAFLFWYTLFMACFTKHRDKPVTNYCKKTE